MAGKVYKNLFVCGCPRSGTSAVATWLNSSDRISVGMERYQKYWNENLSLPIGAFNRDRFFDIKQGDSWYETLEEFSEHYDKINKKWDSSLYIGDKIPAFWKNFAGLFEDYPNSKIIFTYRDPFSVARSYKVRSINSADRNWGARRDLSYGIQEWNESSRKLLNFYNSDKCANILNTKKGIYILSYEEFVSNCFDRKGLSEFLGGPLTLPKMKCNAALDSTEKREFLTNIEKDLIWTLIDINLVKEMRSLINHQRANFLSQPKNKTIKTVEQYHSVDRDCAGISYGEFQIEGCEYLFRGREKPLNLDKPYISCIGSATTFGRFLHKPFPSQLECLTGTPFLNLGIGGGRPETFLANEALIRFLQGSSLVLLEIMSARGYASSIFEPNRPASNMGYFIDYFELEKHAVADMRIKNLIQKSKNNKPVFIDRIYEVVLKYLTKPQRDMIRDEVTNRYCKDIKTLIEIIGKPVVAVYMSRNKPFEARGNMQPKTIDDWTGSHPHFIDEVILDFIRSLNVEVVTSRSIRGFPYVVKNWKTNEPASVFAWQDKPEINYYYPSQEMHDDATQALLKIPIISNLAKNS